MSFYDVFSTFVLPEMSFYDVFLTLVIFLLRFGRIFEDFRKRAKIIGDYKWEVLTFAKSTVILRGVLKVKFTKYCTCAARNPAQHEPLSWDRTEFSSYPN